MDKVQRKIVDYVSMQQQKQLLNGFVIPIRLQKVLAEYSS